MAGKKILIVDQKWNQEIASILSAPEVRETLMKQSMVPAPGSPEEISA